MLTLGLENSPRLLGGQSKGPWLDVCRRWRSAISGIWARSGVTELADSVAVASGQKQTSLRASKPASN